MAWVWSMQCLASFGLLKHLCEFTQKQLEIEYLQSRLSISTDTSLVDLDGCLNLMSSKSMLILKGTLGALSKLAKRSDILHGKHQVCSSRDYCS